MGVRLVAMIRLGFIRAALNGGPVPGFDKS